MISAPLAPLPGEAFLGYEENTQQASARGCGGGYAAPALLAHEAVVRGVEQASCVQGGVGGGAARAHVGLHCISIRHLLLQVLPDLVQTQLQPSRRRTQRIQSSMFKIWDLGFRIYIPKP